jgi:hypothetical protein
MRLEPLYRAEFTYPEGWSVELAGDHGREWQDFYLAEGTCEAPTTPAGGRTGRTAPTSRA